MKRIPTVNNPTLRCPKDPVQHTEFEVTAHVTENWRVDHKGNFMEKIDGEAQVVHRPSWSSGDLFVCASCYTEAEWVDGR